MPRRAAAARKVDYREHARLDGWPRSRAARSSEKEAARLPKKKKKAASQAEGEAGDENAEPEPDGATSTDSSEESVEDIAHVGRGRRSEESESELELDESDGEDTRGLRRSSRAGASSKSYAYEWVSRSHEPDRRACSPDAVLCARTRTAS